jgi:hypothetical protein
VSAEAPTIWLASLIPEAEADEPLPRAEIGLLAVLPDECAVEGDAHDLASVVDVEGLRALHVAEGAEVDDGIGRRRATRRVSAQRGKQDQSDRGESSEYCG